jgi:hypothetical protein
MLEIEGQAIEISSGFDKYNSLRKVYLKLAEHQSEEFFDNFVKTFNDMDDLFLNFKPVATSYMERAVDLSIRELILLGINDISDEVFVERYVQKNSQLDDDCLEVFDRYMKIVLDIEEYEEYKKTRSSGGGSVIGGGFGVEGAVKGVAIASAANLAIGAVGGILNSVADSIKESSNRKEKEQLFRSKETRESLRGAVFNLVFRVHYALMDAVDDNRDDSVYETVSNESSEKARSLLINITKGRIAENDVKNVLINALRLDPYNASLYEYWFEIYGDEDHHILAAEQYFGVVNSKRNAVDNASEAELAADVIGDSTLEEKSATGTCATSGSADKAGPVADSVEDDELFFGGHRYDSAEKANRLRYEYVTNFLESGKSIAEGDKVELKKALDQDKKNNNYNTFSGCLILVSLISMFFITWWYGLLFALLVGVIGSIVSNTVEKSALQRWVANYEEKYGSEK